MAKLLEQLTNIWTARVLVMFGLVAGYVPISSTFDHIGDQDSLLTETSFLPSHSYYHFFREGVGDLTASAVILAIMFMAPKFRSPAMWWIMLITMFGFYAPFWIGAPFMVELRAPFIGAEIAHLRMAIPALLGCFLVRRHYFST